MTGVAMNRFNRRSALKAGTGAFFGAPTLLSLMRKQALAQSVGAKRLIIFYFPEGCAQQAFWPGVGPGALNINMDARVGDGLTPQSRNQSISSYRSPDMGTFCLQPLKPHERDITIMSGFRVQANTANDPHRQVIQSCLTGDRPAEGSFDQVLGPRLQGDTPIPSIFSSLYGEHVKIGVGSAYASPFRTVGGGTANLSWNPVTTYNQIFPNGLPDGVPTGPDHRLTSRLAVMGRVRGRLTDVRCEGGADAQVRLESYLASVERIENETRVLVDQQDEMPAVQLPLTVPPDWSDIRSNNKYWHNPRNFGALMRIQLDTTVAALALNRTNVSFMQFSASGDSKGIDGSHYSHLDIPGLENIDTNDHHMGHNSQGARRRNQAPYLPLVLQSACVPDRPAQEHPGRRRPNTVRLDADRHRVRIQHVRPPYRRYAVHDRRQSGRRLPHRAVSRRPPERAAPASRRPLLHDRTGARDRHRALRRFYRCVCAPACLTTPPSAGTRGAATASHGRRPARHR